MRLLSTIMVNAQKRDYKRHLFHLAVEINREKNDPILRQRKSFINPDNTNRRKKTEPKRIFFHLLIHSRIIGKGVFFESVASDIEKLSQSAQINSPRTSLQQSVE